MHGGLPVIGLSVLVYGVVGAVVIAREALRRCRPWQGRGQAAAPGAKKGARACTAVSR